MYTVNKLNKNMDAVNEYIKKFVKYVRVKARKLDEPIIKVTAKPIETYENKENKAKKVTILIDTKIRDETYECEAKEAEKVIEDILKPAAEKLNDLAGHVSNQSNPFVKKNLIIGTTLRVIEEDIIPLVRESEALLNKTYNMEITAEEFNKQYAPLIKDLKFYKNYFEVIGKLKYRE